MSKKLKDRLRDPVVNRCGQAGDLGQVGLHQPPQVTHIGKIKKKSNFLVIYTVYCRFGISTLSFQVQPVPHKATKAKKAFNLTFRAWCHNLFSTVITLVDWEAAKGIKSPFSALPPLDTAGLACNDGRAPGVRSFRSQLSRQPCRTDQNRPFIPHCLQISRSSGLL